MIPSSGICYLGMPKCLGICGGTGETQLGVPKIKACVLVLFHLRDPGKSTSVSGEKSGNMLYHEFGITYMGDSIIISMPENHLRAVLILVSIG